MNFISDYMRDDRLRHKLNELTLETFGFSFENWVTNGFYEGDYIPYSYEENGQLIANVSANRMDFIQNGKKKHYIQLGTVMTKEAYRNKGCAKQLIQLVINEYKDKCDGIYLFGNMDALVFYDKLGFKRGIQYRYYLKEAFKTSLRPNSECFCKAEANSHRENYQKTVRDSAANSAFEQLNKYGLQLFYTAGMEQIYYSKELDCYVAMEMQENTLLLQSIIADKKISLEQILSRIPFKYDKLILCFTPCIEDSHMFFSEEYDGEDDYRLFYLGNELQSIEAQKLYFPEFSHA